MQHVIIVTGWSCLCWPRLGSVCSISHDWALLDATEEVLFEHLCHHVYNSFLQLWSVITEIRESPEGLLLSRDNNKMGGISFYQCYINMKCIFFQVLLYSCKYQSSACSVITTGTYIPRTENHWVQAKRSYLHFVSRSYENVTLE